MKGTKKLRNFKPSYRKININTLVNEIEILIKTLTENYINEDPKKFWKIIPKIEIET